MASTYQLAKRRAFWRIYAVGLALISLIPAIPYF